MRSCARGPVGRAKRPRGRPGSPDIAHELLRQSELTRRLVLDGDYPTTIEIRPAPPKPSCAVLSRLGRLCCVHAEVAVRCDGPSLMSGTACTRRPPYKFEHLARWLRQVGPTLQLVGEGVNGVTATLGGITVLGRLPGVLGRRLRAAQDTGDVDCALAPARRLPEMAPGPLAPPCDVFLLPRAPPDGGLALFALPTSSMPCASLSRHEMKQEQLRVLNACTPRWNPPLETQGLERCLLAGRQRWLCRACEEQARRRGLLDE